ncbi:MAG: hypothetical protein LBV49_11750 [Azonexus sp.]|jgi:hypothetical protein|nr:hypothetical protein [Azonexus sp.]
MNVFGQQSNRFYPLQKAPMREKKGVVGATFSRPLAAECRPYVIHAIALHCRGNSGFA